MEPEGSIWHLQGPTSSHYVKYRLVLSDFLKSSNIKFHEIRPVGAEFFQADRHDEANGPFRNFANAPKHAHNVHHFYQCDFYFVVVTSVTN